MAEGKQFSSFGTLTPKDDLWFHSIDKSTNKDYKLDGLALFNHILDKIPDPTDFHEYPSYTESTLPDSGILAFEKGDHSGYGNVTVAALKKAMFDFSNPIHCLREFYGDSRNPSLIFGFGTWSLLGAGRVTICTGGGVDVNGVAKGFSENTTGGSYEVILTEGQMPRHNHTANISPNPHNHPLFGNSAGDGGVTTNDGFGSAGSTGNVSLSVSVGLKGNDEAHTNIQPYITVYRWRRIA